MPVPLAAIGLGVGLVGGIGKMFGRGKANKQMKRLLKSDPIYKENPLAAERLGLARTLLNARMPSAAAIERNIFANQANTVSRINKNATDSSQALALAAGTQGQTNQAFENLGVQENQDYYNRLGNLTGAQQGMINEQDKVFQDSVRRWQNKAQIQGAMNANRQNTWGDISNLGFGLMRFGLGGGFKGMGFGGNGGGGNPSGSVSGVGYGADFDNYGSPYGG